ncbi:MAG: neutral/alkaline non-lysosomal ceramidase N-terminal domain-containing protein [Chloroflexota bacterium]
MSSQLLAGVGRVNITPPIGVDLTGTSRRWAPANGIHQDLFATCLVLSTGEDSIALIDCDLLGIPDPTAAEWRARVGAIIGSDGSHVLLACTHTHHGPATSIHMPKIGGDQTQFRDEELAYLANLGYQLESAARLAVAQLQPARLAAGSGTSDLNINRRELLENGKVAIGRNFSGPNDPEVKVLRVDTEAGASLATIINFTSHPALSATLCRLVSSDFYGTARDVVEQLTGATPLYFNGAAGDIITLDYLYNDTSVVENVGRQLGCEAARVYCGINTQPTEPSIEFEQSVSSLKLYRNAPIDRPPITHFQVLNRHLELELQPLPSLAEAEAILAEKHQVLQELREKNERNGVINPFIYQKLWAQKLVDDLKAGTARTTAQAEIQAIRLDDIAFVAIPGEAFVQIALDIKAQSPFTHTFVVAYANGALGYIPMRDDYPKGGYEVENAFKGYGYPSALAPGAAELIVETGVALLHELAED